MEILDIIPDLMPHYNQIWNIHISQTLIASIVGNLVFFGILWFYVTQKKRGKTGSYFVQIIEMLYEQIYSFLGQIWGHGVTPKALTITCTLFMYILRHNIFWLFGDMIVLVWPAAHHRFRPVTTDIMFNGVLAVSVILGSFVYGFSQHGIHFLGKYFSLKGMGLVDKVDKRWKVITKFLDIILGLLIGIIEFLGEFGRMLSLSLRLFGNMFVWMLLLALVLYALQSSIHYPVIAPLLIFAYELAVSLLQALIFAMLATIYFKLAWDKHSH